MQEKQILNRISKAEQRIVDLYKKLTSNGGGGGASLTYKSCIVTIKVISNGGAGALLNVTTHENNLGANLTWAFSSGNKSISCSADSQVFTAGKTWTTTNDFFAKGNFSVIPSILNSEKIDYSFWFNSANVGISYDPGNTDMFIEIRVYN
jgi:hypothetical protein